LPKTNENDRKDTVHVTFINMTKLLSHSPACCCGTDIDATANQCFSSERFGWYRELGKSLGKAAKNHV